MFVNIRKSNNIVNSHYVQTTNIKDKRQNWANVVLLPKFASFAENKNFAENVKKNSLFSKNDNFKS